MKLIRYPTQTEWDEIVALGPGVRMYKGKRTFFYNGEILWEGDDNRSDHPNGRPLVFNKEERKLWQVIIVLPGVEVIPRCTFSRCWNVKTVIMADSVRRIKRSTFYWCRKLAFIRLSTNLEYIGWRAFYFCQTLTSIFIPPSCREIGNRAFSSCTKLIILNVSQRTQLGTHLIVDTELFEASTFQAHDEFGHYDDTDGVNAWIKSINNSEGLALHRICSSNNPDMEEVYGHMKDHGLRAMKLTNDIGITPSQYLAVNPHSEIEEVKLVKRFILEMMGEVLQQA